MPYKDSEKQKQAKRDWYKRNKAKVAETSRQQRARNREWLNEQKSVPCQDCKLTWPPYVMEYHHRIDEEKLDSVGNLLMNAGRQRVLDEIAKCDLLCSNCHRVRTHG